MPIVISSRATSSPLNTGTTNYLTGNVGDWLKTTILCKIWAGFDTTQQDTVTINTNNIWTLGNGGNWEDLGAEVGDTILMSWNRRDATDPNAADTTETENTLTITALNGSQMTVSGALDSDEGQAFTIPGQSGLYIYNWAKIVFDKTFTGLEAKYNQTTNASINANSLSLSSLFDGNETVFTGGGLNAADTTNWVTLNQSSIKSGSDVTLMRVKGNGKSAGVSQFYVEITHCISGIYEDLAVLQNETPPEWYFNNETMADLFKLKFYKTFGNENLTISTDLSDTQVKKLGNTGWFNENKNGNTNIYSISDVVWKDFNNHTKIGLMIDNQVSTLTFKITGTGFDTTNTKFNFGIAHTPINFGDLQGKTKKILNLMTANTMGVYNVYSHGATPTVGTISGFENLNGGKIDVESYHFKVNSATEVVCEMKFKPNAAFVAEFETKDNVDLSMIWWVSVGDSTQSLATTGRVNLMKIGVFSKVEEIILPHKNMGINYYKYNLDGFVNLVNDNNDGLAIMEDDFNSVFAFIQKPNAKINWMKIGIAAINTSTSEFLNEFESQLFDFSNAPIDYFGVQQISVTGSRGICNYPNDFKNNKILFKREPSLDDGDNKAYLFHYPFFMRHEWWQPAPLNGIYYVPTEPNHNLNKMLRLKEINNFKTCIFAEFSTTDENGKTRTWRNFKRMSEVNYNANIEIALSQAHFRNSIYTVNAEINAAFTDYYTAKMYGVKRGDMVYVKGNAFKADYDFENITYLEATIESRNGQGMTEMWKLRSDVTNQQQNNPLKPISGELTITYELSVGNIDIYFNIDTSLLPNATDYKVTIEVVGGFTRDKYAYLERNEVWLRLIDVPVLEGGDDRDFDECKCKNLVLGDLEDEDRFKNDITGVLNKVSDTSSNIEYYLVSENGEYSLNDGTFGALFDFGSFVNEPLQKGYQLQWRKVLDEAGEGCYKIKTVISEIGYEVVNYSCCYELKHFSVETANNTVRLESVRTDFDNETGINYLGTFWISDFRLMGKFGYEEFEYEQTFIVDENNANTLNRSTLKGKYKLNTQLLDYDCQLKPIINYYLQSDNIYVSDYNEDNHRWDYKRVPVTLDSVSDTTYFANNRKSRITINFDEKIIKRRTFTATGNEQENALNYGNVVNTKVVIESAKYLIFNMTRYPGVVLVDDDYVEWTADESGNISDWVLHVAEELPGDLELYVRINGIDVTDVFSPIINNALESTGTTAGWIDTTFEIGDVIRIEVMSRGELYTGFNLILKYI